MEYFDPDDEYYWYEGKKLNNTYKPEVYILSDKVKKGRKMIIFECRVPKSDVYLSLKPMASRSSHSHPLPPRCVTVSAFHVKLNFIPLAGINVNLKKQTQSPITIKSTKSTKKYIYSDKAGHEAESEPESNVDESTRKSVNRYMIFYDGKCRNCTFNVANSSLDSDLYINPLFYKSVKCNLKAHSCVYEGKCYLENETNAASPLDKPTFTCDTKTKEISSVLFMPCEKNNGNCDMHQKCEFDEINNRVRCINSIHL